jgi:uncharacterized repeat protein (TIGR01451 family)
MKKVIIKINTLLLIGLLFISLSSIAQNFQPINLNTSPITGSCSANGGSFNVSIPTEVLSGDNIPLNISLPGTLDVSCDINISINYSSPNNKLQFVTSSNIVFSQTGNTLNTTNPLPGNDGQNFNVFFKFPNHITCNGELGTIRVTFEACGETCTTEVSIIARAANYWTVKKEFVIGDLVCGTSKWLVKIIDNNPNPSGYGNYKIQGTLTENVSIPVISGAVINISGNNWIPYKYVTLQNCQNAGTSITNDINYNFTLGDGCETMQGTASAVSPPLQSPNTSLDFTKSISSSSGIPYYASSSGYYELSAGCSAVYQIGIYNDGNVPWQINSISDVIPTGITITGVSDVYWGMGYTGIDPNMWVNSPTITGQTYTFTPATSPYILNPGDYKSIYLYFDISSAPAGSLITNNAHINYNAGGVGNAGGGSGTQCNGVNCPIIDQSIQNKDAAIDFMVVVPYPKEIFTKCITNQPAVNIYNIGDTVHFKFILGNGGSGSLNTTITDYLGLPNQNLQIVPSSISYAYFENNSFASIGWPCGNNFSNPQPINFVITPNTTDLQNPSFTISGLPGTCVFNRANYLVIEFDAEILVQIYGSKTNTAYTNSHQNSASYTIDQIGVLEVNKYADQEFVENGGNFNYIIEVTNSGSVPLDHITINDQIPSCVQINENIQITDFAGTNINYNISGNLSLNLNPTWQLLPGQTATITLPATKIGGGQCCNESVSAYGTMITSGVVLEANFGTSNEPAACVKSTECCDIEGFEAHLYENNDGSYSVMVNGGSVPIQQVDISVIDYHVEYNQRDCQPQDMGAFGMLSTQTQVFNGLLLDVSSNNTSNLTWMPGNPSVMNSGIDFTISKPNVLDLECCDVDFYFCIKVSVKDVNCNVCEKVICIEKKPEPCTIRIKAIKDSYCLKDTINISWTGVTSSGLVNVYIKPANGGSATLIASNQPDTGSLNWTIPTNMKPCDSDWVIIVANIDNPEECYDVSNTFTIRCCETACNCLGWQSEIITYFEKIIGTPHADSVNPTTKGKEYDTSCGGIITLKTDLVYEFISPQFNCSNATCTPEYSWIITNNATGVSGVTIGGTINLQFNSPGTYTVEIASTCDGIDCDKCSFTIHVEGKIITPNQTGRILTPGSGNITPTNTQDWNSSRSNKFSKTL